MKNKIEYIPKFVITSTNARKYFVSKGLGIGFGIKDNIKKELENGELVELKISKKPLIRSIGIATQTDDMLNSATIKMIEILKKL